MTAGWTYKRATHEHHWGDGAMIERAEDGCWSIFVWYPSWTQPKCSAHARSFRGDITAAKQWAERIWEALSQA